MLNSENYHSTQPISSNTFGFLKAVQILLFTALSFAITPAIQGSHIHTFYLSGISLIGFIFSYLWNKFSNKEVFKIDYYASKVCATIWAAMLLAQSIYIFMGYTDESVFQFVCIVLLVVVSISNLYKQSKVKAETYYRTAIEELLNLHESTKNGSTSLTTLESTLYPLYKYLKIMKSEHTEELYQALINFRFSLMKKEQTLQAESIYINSAKVQYLFHKIQPFFINSSDELEILMGNNLTINLSDTLIDYLKEIESDNSQLTTNRYAEVKSQLIDILIDLKREESKLNHKEKGSKLLKAFILFMISFFGIGIITALMLSGSYFEYIYHMLFPTLLNLIAIWSYFKIKSLR